jgi:hypothetical protein
VTNCSETKFYYQALFTKASILESQNQLEVARQVYEVLAETLPTDSKEVQVIRKRIQKYSESIWPQKTEDKLDPKI